MSTSLVVTGGTTEAQYDTSIPRPALREAPLEDWLSRQPEYSAAHQLWVGRHLTGEVFVERVDGALIAVTVDISGRGTPESKAEFEQVRARLGELAGLLGGKVWDDDEEAFVDGEE